MRQAYGLFPEPVCLLSLANIFAAGPDRLGARGMRLPDYAAAAATYQQVATDPNAGPQLQAIAVQRLAQLAPSPAGPQQMPPQQMPSQQMPPLSHRSQQMPSQQMPPLSHRYSGGPSMPPPNYGAYMGRAAAAFDPFTHGLGAPAPMPGWPPYPAAPPMSYRQPPPHGYGGAGYPHAPPHHLEAPPPFQVQQGGAAGGAGVFPTAPPPMPYSQQAMRGGWDA